MQAKEADRRSNLYSRPLNYTIQFQHFRSVFGRPQTLPLSRPCTAFLRGLGQVKPPSKIQSISSRLVDVLEAIGTQVNPAKVAGHDDQYIVHLLETRVSLVNATAIQRIDKLNGRALDLRGSGGGGPVYLRLQFPRRHHYLSHPRSEPLLSQNTHTGHRYSSP